MNLNKLSKYLTAVRRISAAGSPAPPPKNTPAAPIIKGNRKEWEWVLKNVLRALQDGGLITEQQAKTWGDNISTYPDQQVMQTLATLSKLLKQVPETQPTLQPMREKMYIKFR